MATEAARRYVLENPEATSDVGLARAVLEAVLEPVGYLLVFDDGSCHLTADSDVELVAADTAVFRLRSVVEVPDSERQ